MKYYNNGFTAIKSDFVDVDSNVGQVNSLTFRNKPASVKTAAGATKMVSGEISLQAPFKVACAEDCQDITLNSSVTIKWNIRYADPEGFAALRNEVLRVLALAETNYGLTKGLVPPVTADFASE